MDVAKDPGSKIGRLAAAAALITPALLAMSVLCAFAYDVSVGLGGLIAVFLLASAPLALVGVLDVRGWRRITAARDPALHAQSASDVSRAAAAGLALLLFGALFTVIEVGVGGVKNSDFEAWTSTTVGYLLTVALATQAILLGLAWLMRRNALAPRT